MDKRLSGTTKGFLSSFFRSSFLPLNNEPNKSLACTTPIKSSSSPEATGNIERLLSMIFALFSLSLSSRSNHTISFLGVIIISTF